MNCLSLLKALMRSSAWSGKKDQWAGQCVADLMRPLTRYNRVSDLRDYLFIGCINWLAWENMDYAVAMIMDRYYLELKGISFIEEIKPPCFTSALKRHNPY